MFRLLQFAAMARLAAIEAIRRPVFLLVSLSCLAAIVLMPLLLNYTLGDSARMIRDSAFAIHLVGGLLLGAYAAAEGLSRELRRGTAATILAKPVPRALFLLARATGVWAALLLFSAAALTATLLAVRAGASDLSVDRGAALPALAAVLLAPALAGIWNRRTRRPFTSVAFFLLLVFLLAALAISAAFRTPYDHLAFPHNVQWSLVPAGLLPVLCLGMAVALATALSTRMAPLSVLLAVAGVFMLGLMADPLFAPHLDASRAARAAYTLLPNIQAFWLADALDAATPIPPAYFGWTLAYAAAWSTAVLCAGLAAFRRLEIT